MEPKNEKRKEWDVEPGDYELRVDLAIPTSGRALAVMLGLARGSTSINIALTPAEAKEVALELARHAERAVLESARDWRRGHS